MTLLSEEQTTINPEFLTKARETIQETPIKELLVIKRRTFPDGRGFFRELFRKSELEAILGRKFDISQANHSHNEQKGILRGLHIAPWDKLIYVTRGRVQVVIVDTRPDSPTFGQCFSTEIGDPPSPTNNPEEDNKDRVCVLVPKGCANGYQTLTDESDYTYQVDDEWYPESEKALKWDDPTVNAPWKQKNEVILSDRDKTAKTLQELYPEKFS
jgi:dTDP-4-dehydrorhamnose 3,5-epimerase